MNLSFGNFSPLGPIQADPAPGQSLSFGPAFAGLGDLFPSQTSQSPQIPRNSGAEKARENSIRQQELQAAQEAQASSTAQKEISSLLGDAAFGGAGLLLGGPLGLLGGTAFSVLLGNPGVGEIASGIESTVNSAASAVQQAGDAVGDAIDAIGKWL
jgi:hypothetical protein